LRKAKKILVVQVYSWRLHVKRRSAKMRQSVPTSLYCSVYMGRSHSRVARDRNLRDLAQISRRDRDFVINAETETWKFETETRDLTFL